MRCDSAKVIRATTENETMSYITCFPDYDRHDDADTLLAAGWSDASWRNDACPSFQAGGVRLFLDYAAPDKREFTDCEDVASLHFLNHRGEFTDIPPQGFPSLKAALAGLYEGLIGYDPFADDSAITAREVARTVVEYFNERDA
jgi:hypothetical protein